MLKSKLKADAKFKAGDTLQRLAIIIVFVRLQLLDIKKYSMTQLVSVLLALLTETTSCMPVPQMETGRSSPHAAGNQWERQ